MGPFWTDDHQTATTTNSASMPPMPTMEELQAIILNARKALAFSHDRFDEESRKHPCPDCGYTMNVNREGSLHPIRVCRHQFEEMRRLLPPQGSPADYALPFGAMHFAGTPIEVVESSWVANAKQMGLITE